MALYSDGKTTSAKEILKRKSKYNARIIGGMTNRRHLIWQNKKIKDFINSERIFFGRVDHENDPIVVKSSNLKSIGKDRNVLAVNFVADAFMDLSGRFEKALRSGHAKGNVEPFSSFKAIKAYDNIRSAYKGVLEFRRSRFLATAAVSDWRKDILNFETFLPFFGGSIQSDSLVLPITRSGLLKTTTTSPLSSGLMVEFFKGDYNNDMLKYENFYKQRDFKLLKNMAYQHGFVVDKHIPWRLVADIGSPNMAPYIRKYFPHQMDHDLFFPEFYKKAYSGDINHMIETAVYFYNSFVNRFPRHIGVDCQSSRKKPKVKKLQRVTFEQVIDEGIDLYYWISLYVVARNNEEGLGYGESTMIKIIENAVDLGKSLDNTASLRYINSKFNNVEHNAGSIFHDDTRREMSVDPDATEQSVDEVVKMSVQTSNFKTY